MHFPAAGAGTRRAMREVMGFFDPILPPGDACARVTLELASASAYPGGPLRVKLVIRAGALLEARGVFVDLVATESVHQPGPLTTRHKHTVRIAGDFALAAGEVRSIDATVTIPVTAQPTFAGAFASHTWSIRGRLATFGHDPDSGYQPLRIGLGA